MLFEAVSSQFWGTFETEEEEEEMGVVEDFRIESCVASLIVVIVIVVSAVAVVAIATAVVGFIWVVIVFCSNDNGASTC